LSGDVLHDDWPMTTEARVVPPFTLSRGVAAGSMSTSDPARFVATLSSKSVAPGIAVIVSGSCSPVVVPSLLAAAGGVSAVTVTIRTVCAGFHTQFTFVPQTQLPMPFV